MLILALLTAMIRKMVEFQSGVARISDLSMNFALFGAIIAIYEIINRNLNNEVECIRAAGTTIAPADAHRSALEVADIVLVSSGGCGAVSEIADAVLDRINQCVE